MHSRLGMRPVLVALSCLAIAVGTTRPAEAFKEAGHRAIEAAAYRELLETTAGRQALATLIAEGVLNPPSAPLPGPTELLDPEYATYTVDSLVVASHFPDHLFDRQLQADRQCFHFNAAGGDYKLTDVHYGNSRIPLGLVEDAYVQCIGVADSVLRGVLFDPRASQKAGTGMYTMMHIVEDSFADSHVARDQDWRILYVKPWNLRTWPRYFFANKHSEPIRSHFSAEHHMGSDTRDLGYLVGPTDEDYDAKKNIPTYQALITRCVNEGAQLIRRHRMVDYQDHPITIVDMQGELVVPSSCLSRRALRAKDAIVDLLSMVAKLAPVVTDVRRADGAPIGTSRNALKQVHWEDPNTSAVSILFSGEWLSFRRRHLAHYDDYLTEHMARRQPGPPPPDLRGDLVQSSEALTPRKFRESGLGLSTELRSGTPLWLGLEEFMSRDASSHNRPVILLDSLGWGAQVRLPIKNEMGESPVGVAFDVGVGLPLPLSELLGINELQVYCGVRGRATYTAQSVFEKDTRHRFEFGFGGVSLDFIIGNTAWFGLDAPRKLYSYDLWSKKRYGWEDTIFSFSGGLAIDAF